MTIEQIIAIIFSLLVAIIGHEIAHGKEALKHGDKTALNQGRLSWNPIVHIDVIGTILLPLMMFFSGLPIIGYAKPVPVNYRILELNKNYLNIMKVAFAGIKFNLILMTIFIFISLVLSLEPNKENLFSNIIFYGIIYNLVLALFNLIPLPPLDGSKILSSFLKTRNLFDIAYKIENFNPMIGMLFIIILMNIEFIRNGFFFIIISIIEYVNPQIYNIF